MTNTDQNTPPGHGRTYWRSLDELATTSQFGEFLHREFPSFAGELTSPSRRNFLKVMGASLALAGAATIPGCRRPEHKILAYDRKPEDVIHGKPLYYASALVMSNGHAEGVLVETHDGRPTKIEGNPLHPGNQGKSSATAQAAILNLYDPDRLRHPVSRVGGDEEQDATWSDFWQFADAHFARYDATSGQGLAFVVDTSSSLSRDAVRDNVIRNRWSNALWLPYDALDNENQRNGLSSVLGGTMSRSCTFQNATRVLSIDDDFLGGEDARLSDIRGFASGRRVRTTHGDGSEMNRLYVIESSLSITGGSADHRLRLKPSGVTVAGMEVLASILRKLGGSSNIEQANAVDSWIKRSTDSTEGFIEPPREWIEACADDLLSASSTSLIVAGASQAPVVHATVAAVNQALGATGSTIQYQQLGSDASVSSRASLQTLSDAIDGGSISTLVVIGRNPAYDAPANLGLAQKLASVGTLITLDPKQTETGALASWQLNGCEDLERWGDALASDGTISVIQPMIAPLFDGVCELGFLQRLAQGEGAPDAYDTVRAALRGAGVAGDDKTWRRSLHNGIVAGTGGATATPSVNSSQLVSMLNTPTALGSGLEVVFRACPKLRDGTDANNGWLQELPDPVTKLTWDNPALVSPATAERLGLLDTSDTIGVQRAPMATLEIGGRSMEIPVWRQPGLPDDVVVLTVGYGRTSSGVVGTGTGFDTYQLRTSDAMRTASGATISRAGGSYPIASTQDHHAMEDRAVLREVDVQAWREHGDELDTSKDAYGVDRRNNFAARLGTEGHTPVNRDVYDPDQLHDYSVGPQWGMSIDLASCIGCGVCTIACQAENNIPIVGKTEVNKGREMHWIRVDRYFTGDADGDVDMAVQPVGCVHCEAAPCETVCPVNATVHGPQGTNDMAYNRCIGTRYCSNNCPYKVRRFNFFDYATKKYKGDYTGKSVLGGVVNNDNMIPPRLREPLEEIEHLKFNPDVTVRERGVMEKCTYCMQRINAAHIENEIAARQGKGDHEHAIPDGYFQSACQQACPADAISFGDILDEHSRVAQEKANGRTYAMLAYLNTRPRTTYMVGLRNPNPLIREPEVDVFHGHGGGHDDHASDSHGSSDTGDSHTNDEGHVMSLPVLNDVLATAMAGGVA
ncbi:MAG: TAT-variant-translocated molybdopterin oxidoreductase [Phycisphaerales bacterium JB043]